MLSKSIKFSIVFAIILAIFSGTALADRRAHKGGHQAKWNRAHHQHNKYQQGYHHQAPRHRYQYYARRPYRHHAVQRPVYHQKHHPAYASHPLAPRIVFLGPIPVPVPPPPHVVLNFIAGH